jgi:hypothetical protein
MLFFESTHWPAEVHATLASLDDTHGLQPAAHAYWRDRVAWADWSGRSLQIVEPPDHA